MAYLRIAISLVLGTAVAPTSSQCTEFNSDGFCDTFTCDAAGYGCLFCPCTCTARGSDCSTFGVGNTDDDFGESEEETDAVPITTESPPTSPSPTSPPPTRDSPSPPPTSPQTTLASGTCPRNCGVPDRGGGTCRTNGRCRSCNDNRVLQGGRCYASIACKGRRIQTGSQTGATCRCLEDNCHYCNRLADGDTCRVCRDGTYLLDGACVESCPLSMTSLGLGQFKRRCLAPFECRNGRIVGSDASYGCKCATDAMAPSACQYCQFQAGGFGQHCTRCLGGLFLQADNRCHGDCDGTGLIEYNPGNYGRECRLPFTCTDRTDEDGTACQCARSVGKNDCVACDYVADGVSCSRCTNSKYLQDGTCVDACREGALESGSGVDGRECL